MTPKVEDPGEGHVTFVYHNKDSGQLIPYVMNDMAAAEVNTAASQLLDALDELRAGQGDPLAAIEGIASWLFEIAGPV